MRFIFVKHYIIPKSDVFLNLFQNFVIQISHQATIFFLRLGVDIAFLQEIVDAEVIIGCNGGAKQVKASHNGDFFHLPDELSLQT